MDSAQRKNLILELLKESGEIDALSVMNVLKVDTHTLTQDFKSLLFENKMIRTTPWKYTEPVNVQSYLSQAVSKREIKIYNEDFLSSYIPNQDFLLSEETILKLQEKKRFRYSYTENLSLMENIYIELSYYSNILEWETSYSLLDTEVCIKFGHFPKWVSYTHSQKILNYKNIINILFEWNADAFTSEIEIHELHTLLTQWKIETHLQWTLRSFQLFIKNTSYQTIADLHFLETQFELFLEKLEKIDNVYEKAFFVLVFLPYIAPYSNYNLELSRILVNAILISHWCSAITFRDVNLYEYEFAYNAVYELWDLHALKKIFLNGIKNRLL